MKFINLVFLLAFTALFPTQVHADAFSEIHKPTNPPLKMPPLVFEDDHKVQHALSDYRGKFVLLNIWASWCGPCVKEMPSLEVLQKAFDPQKLVVIPLSEDRGDSTISAFYQTHGLTKLPIAIDNGGAAPASLKLRGLPTTMLINPEGFEIERVEGSTDWGTPEAIGFIKSSINALNRP